MRQLIAAGVRTAVQAAVTLLAAWLVSIGINIDPEVTGQVAQALDAFLFAVTIGVVTLGMNALENRFPVLSPFFSLFLTTSGPDYETQ